jgi:hypothetical protein
MELANWLYCGAMDGSLITDEVRALVGMSTEPVTITLTRDVVQQAMHSVTGAEEGAPDDGMPAGAAAMAALEGAIAPLQTPRILPNGMVISNEWSVERQLLVGEAFECVRRVVDVSERLGGRFGHCLYIRVEAEIRDMTGVVAARCGTTSIQFDPANERGREE